MVKKASLGLSKNSTVLFVTFSMWEKNKRLPTNGSVEPMRDFLVPKIGRLTLIDQPHPGSDRVMPRIEVYENNSLKFKLYKSSRILRSMEPVLKKFNKNSTQPLFKIRDLLSVLDWSFRDRTKYDYCICLESINAIAGIILRKLGRVDKVVYYVSDYSPNRYKSKWFNELYLRLDRFSAMHADFIWDVSPAMQKARLSVGLDSKKSAPVIIVANGLLPEQIKSAPISSFEKHGIVYMGTVGSENGPDIAIKSLQFVINKFKDAKLHIVGGTNKDHVWLKEIVKELGIDDSVIFHGFIESHIDVAKIMRKCAVGVAPYKSIPGSIRYYADAGKIRAYCAAGLPVISSKVPPLGLMLAKKGGAIIVNDDPREFAEAIIGLFKDKKNYSFLKNNAEDFARTSTWENTFANAFKFMDNKKI